MVGIDSSPSMLAAARPHASPNVRFEHGDIAGWTAPGDHDLVLSNAALHWVPDHPRVLARWVAALGTGRAARGAGPGQPRPPVASVERRGRPHRAVPVGDGR